MDYIKKRTVSKRKSCKIQNLLLKKNIYVKKLEYMYKTDLENFAKNFYQNSISVIWSEKWIEKYSQKNTENYIMRYKPNWDCEFTAYHSWYLAWINKSICKLKDLWNTNNEKQINIKYCEHNNVIKKIDVVELNFIAEEYATEFLNNELTDVETIYFFLSYLNKKNYFWEGNNIWLVWSNDNPYYELWNEYKAFDVHYNHIIRGREYSTSVEYIEYLNETKDKQIIIEELKNIAYKIEDHIKFLDNF